MESPSKEVRFLINMVKYDQRSVTGQNIDYISNICKDDIIKLASWRVKQMLPKESVVEQWRSSLLTTLLQARWDRSQSNLGINKVECEEMIKSLCIS